MDMDCGDEKRISLTVPTGEPLSIQSRAKAQACSVNLNAFGSKDFESLKEKDPFLYYSIPSARDSYILHRDGGQKLKDCCKTPIPQPALVSRKSCITFEYHDSLVMKDMIFAQSGDDDKKENTKGSENDVGAEEEDDEYLFDIIELIRKKTRGN
mmetsp:Transcript_20129/g.39801  ORF Transcript_20129/g.39801 Transcript_20129/m.39801 type:complete len:154 (+) Transcript_20129:192-653(+)